MNEANQEFLRLLRASGWHQARAARELDLNTGTITRYVKGQAVPSIQVLRLFAGILKEPLLLDGHAAQHISDGPRWLEDWESDVITSLRRLEPAKRTRVIKALGEMLDAMTVPARYAASPQKAPTVDDIVAQKLAALSAIGTAPGSASSPPIAAPEPASCESQAQGSRHRRGQGGRAARET